MIKGVVICLILVGSLWGWMNVTPGYFRLTCCGCGIEYAHDACGQCGAIQVECSPLGPWAHLLLFIARFDYNR